MSSELISEDEVWDDDANVPVPDWHLRLIEQRLAEDEANGHQRIPWEEVEKELIELINKPVQD